MWLCYPAAWSQLSREVITNYKARILVAKKILLYYLMTGDLLFLTNYEDEEIRVGEIVVFKIDGRDIPIVHR